MESKESSSSMASTASIDPVDLEDAEQRFQLILDELRRDDSLERYCAGFEILLTQFNHLKQREKKLTNKCKDLNTEIVNTTAKMQTALKLSQEDQETISALKIEMEKAWKMVDAAKDKEARSREVISQLKDEVGNLSRIVREGAGLEKDKENIMTEIQNLREELRIEREERERERESFESKEQSFHRTIEELEQDIEEIKAEKSKLQQEIEHRKLDTARQENKQKHLEKELQQMSRRIQKQTERAKEMEESLLAATKRADTLSAEAVDNKSSHQSLMRDFNQLQIKEEKLREIIATKDKQIEAMDEERKKLEESVKSREIELSQLRLEKGMMERKVDKVKQVAVSLEKRLDRDQTTKKSMQSEIHSMQKEINAEKKVEAEQSREIESLQRKEEVHLRNLQKMENKAKLIESDVKESERVNKNLEQELNAYRQEASKQRKIIYQLERDRENIKKEIFDQKALVQAEMDKVKIRDITIEEMNKQLSEAETKIAKQQQAYEAAMNERNFYSRSLVEAKDSLEEMAQASKIMSHQIEQLKDEINAKNHALVKEHFDKVESQKQRDLSKSDVSRLRDATKKSEETIRIQEKEIYRLNVTVQKLDEETLMQKKEYDQILSERDLLATALVRRNDELALLYEKLRLLQSTLKKGELQYLQRVQDLRALRTKLNETQRDLIITRKKTGHIEEMKREIIQYQKQLLAEQGKVKALSEELEKPANVHRWRKLEGSDPAAFEMIQKIQGLQKRLIFKTEEVAERDLVIQEKDKAIADLKDTLKRQPKPEVFEELLEQQQMNKEKLKQIKSLTSEVTMYQIQIKQYKQEIEQLNLQLKEEKKKYFEQKSKLKKQQIREGRRENQKASRSSHSTHSPSNNAHGGEECGGHAKQDQDSSSSIASEQYELAKKQAAKIAGGGFNFASQ